MYSVLWNFNGKGESLPNVQQKFNTQENGKCNKNVEVGGEIFLSFSKPVEKEWKWHLKSSDGHKKELSKFEATTTTKMSARKSRVLGQPGVLAFVPF